MVRNQCLIFGTVSSIARIHKYSSKGAEMGMPPPPPTSFLVTPFSKCLLLVSSRVGSTSARRNMKQCVVLRAKTSLATLGF